MTYELTYTPGEAIEVACVGETGYRVAQHYAKGASRIFELLAPDLETQAAAVAQQEATQVAIKEATAALQAENESLRAQIGSAVAATHATPETGVVRP